MTDDSQSRHESPASPKSHEATPSAGASDPRPAPDHGRRSLVAVACVAAVAGACLGVWAFSAGAASAGRQMPAQQSSIAAPSSSQQAPSSTSAPSAPAEPSTDAPSNDAGTSPADTGASGSSTSGAATSGSAAPASTGVLVDVDGHRKQLVDVGQGATALDALKAAGATVETDSAGAIVSVDGRASGNWGYWQLEVNDRRAAADTPVVAGDQVECDFEDFD
ncbi:hypothetical protein AAK967_00345 [Atopobiaceae bacterium 24-176]